MTIFLGSSCFKNLPFSGIREDAFRNKHSAMGKIPVLFEIQRICF